VGRFLAKRCELRPGAKARASALLGAYREWSGDRRFTQRELATRPRERGLSSRHGKGNVVFWHGVHLPVEDTF
jgi:hypothetical protein